MNTPVKIGSMGRVVSSLGLAGLLSAVVGCATNPDNGGPQVMTRPSHQTLSITFPTDQGPPPTTEVVVSPGDGDVILTAVKAPTDKENTVVWTSVRSFSIKFMQIDDHAKKPSKKLGDELDEWNHSTGSAGNYVYTLRLKPGNGRKKTEIMGAKYIVKSPMDCDERQPGPHCLVLDPVIIVRY